MHLLMVVNTLGTPDHPSEGRKYQQFAQAFRRKGLQVGVVAIAQKTGPRRRRPFFAGPCLVADREGEVPVYRDYFRTVMPKALKHRTGDRRSRAALERYVRRHGRPDLVHAFSTFQAGRIVQQWLRGRAIPYVVTENMTRFSGSELRPGDYEQTLPVLRDAAYNMPLSDPLGDQLERFFGAAARPWQAFPNVIDPQAFTLGETAWRGRHRGAFTFFNVGRMQDVKDQANLLRAFAYGTHELGWQATVLRLGGDGPLRGGLEALARELGVADRVAFLGRLERDQVLAEMQACDAYVLSSRLETFALPLIEATACGTPVVATMCVGPEMVVTATNGELVPPGDPQALGAAMGRVRNAIDSYDPAAIRAECVARFGEDAVIERVIATYWDLLAVPA